MPGEADQEWKIEKLVAGFIVGIYRVFKSATIYERNNELIQRLTQECCQAINSFIESESRLIFKILGEDFFFNQTRLQIPASIYPLIKSFAQEMKKRWIGKLEFSAEVGEETLREFIYLFVALKENDEGNFLLLQKQLEQRGILNISAGILEFPKEDSPKVDSEKQKRYAKEIYFKTINLVKELNEGVRSKKKERANIRKAKHFIQNAVNSIVQDESSLLGLATIKNYDEATYNHSVNVAIYAIALGQRVGVPKKQLAYLGLAGIFHDMGKTRIPIEILNKPGKLTPEEWAVVRSHPLFGAEAVIWMKEWGESSSWMVVTAFEHHLKFDLSGYPKLVWKRNVNLFSKIITVADFYDALARPRVYRQYPFLSEKILGMMLEQSGKDFDPALVKIFVNMMGVYPLGSLVLLNTGEMGIVVQIPEDQELIDRPKVCLLHFSEGQYKKGMALDLRETEENTGVFKRSIVQTLDPNEYGIHIGEFMI